MIYSFKTEESHIGFDFDVKFDKNQKVYCIIGKNGIGKTHLLENMAKALIFSDYIRNKFENKKLSISIKPTLNNISMRNENELVLDSFKFKFHKLGFVCEKPIIFIGAKNRRFTKNINPDNIKILGNQENRFIESFTRTLNYIEGKGKCEAIDFLHFITAKYNNLQIISNDKDFEKLEKIYQEFKNKEVII